MDQKATQWDIQRVREFIRGCVTTVQLPSAPVVTSVSVPAFITAGKQKSEYEVLDVDDEAQRAAELSRGLSSLRGWYHRYAGLATIHQCPIDAEIGAVLAKLESALTG